MAIPPDRHRTQLHTDPDQDRAHSPKAQTQCPQDHRIRPQTLRLDCSARPFGIMLECPPASAATVVVCPHTSGLRVPDYLLHSPPSLEYLPLDVNQTIRLASIIPVPELERSWKPSRLHNSYIAMFSGDMVASR